MSLNKIFVAIFLRIKFKIWDYKNSYQTHIRNFRFSPAVPGESNFLIKVSSIEQRILYKIDLVAIATENASGSQLLKKGLSQFLHTLESAIIDEKIVLQHFLNLRPCLSPKNVWSFLCYTYHCKVRGELLITKYVC